MLAKYKIGIWGQFGDGGKIADGQAVKTIILAEELKDRYGEENILIINTNNWRKHPFKFLFNTIKLNARCKKVIIFPADNGFKVGVPIFNFINKFFRREMYYGVIGGFLPKVLEKKPKYLKMLKKYKALFVETPSLKADVERFGLDKVYILANYKKLTARSSEKISVCTDEKIKLCTFSRVDAAKGIVTAIEAVKMANEKLGGNFVSLDVYGMIAEYFKDNFNSFLSENSEFLSYCGIVNFNKTTDTLSNYFAMLFPTYYHGEGFPGNLLDAFNAGIPIIATDWRYNSDVIKDGYNGILVPIKDPEAVCNAILDLYNNREKQYQISLNNIKEAEEYKADKVLKTFYSFMD